MSERSERYGIAEWYGEPFATMPPARRRDLAAIALGQGSVPRCPFQRGDVPCTKGGGVCSIQKYRPYLGNHLADRIGEPTGSPAITCPRRFEQDALVPRWLARIVGFQRAFLAKEVPFMRSPATGRPAGRIDIVLSENSRAAKWFGLEIPSRLLFRQRDDEGL